MPLQELRRPICIDLFSGAGGLALGFERAGFDIAAAVEFDPVHAAVHELNFPTSKMMCQDVRTVSGSSLRDVAGIGNKSIDVVIGGPPCQGFSLIGHRVLSDPRNQLVFHFLRLVDELRPKTFLFENVAGMASGAHHRLLEELIDGFERIGYRVRWPYSILNAANFGVPQNRRRLFLLGARKGFSVPSYPEAVSRIADRPTKPERFDSELPSSPSVIDAIGDLPALELFPELLETDVLDYELKPWSDYAMKLRREIPDLTDFSYNRANRPRQITGCLRAVHSEKSQARFQQTLPGETEPISRFFRLPPNGVCNTLRAGTASDHGAFTSPRPIHPIWPRCITVREAARLHSFPDWFRFHKTIWHGFRQIGNSVPPLLAQSLGRQVIASLGIEPKKPNGILAMGKESLAQLNMQEAARHFGISHRVIASRRKRSAAAVP